MLAYGCTVLRGRTVPAFVGLAAAVVPVAVVIHLAAEIAALGPDVHLGAFVLRHAYLAVLLLAATWIFASTVGIGQPCAERVRRCAIARAGLERASSGRGFTMVFAANILSFALTQAVEGVPIAAGSLALGVAVAAGASLAAAFILFAFGRRFAAAMQSVIVGARSRPTVPGYAKVALSLAARTAAAAFSLFAPNRPPPSPSLI